MSERISLGRNSSESEVYGSPSVAVPRKLEPIKNHQFSKLRDSEAEKGGDTDGVE